MANPSLDYAKELLRQELQELNDLGNVKRKLYQQELDTYLELHRHLEYKWQKKRRKTLLHAHMTAIRSPDNLVPSNVLSKQAKLSQCLQSMEIEMRQCALVETQRKALVALLANQVARQEEIHSRNSLQTMNQMCVLENEIKEMQEQMRSWGFSFQEEQTCQDGVPTNDETLRSWWWLVKKHVTNEAKAHNTESNNNVHSSWWPVLDKVIMMTTNDATNSVSDDTWSETSSRRLPSANEETAMDSSQSNKVQQESERDLRMRIASSDPSTTTETDDKTTRSDGSDDHSSVKCEETADNKARTTRPSWWWPVVVIQPDKQHMSDDSDHSGVSFDDHAQPFSRTWWPVKSEEK